MPLYAVVEFIHSNEIEIVNQNWIFLFENGQYITLFPPKSKYRTVLHSNDIDENWKTFKILILKQNIENYKLAIDERNYREKGDTDTNDEMIARALLKRKHPVWESQENSLNLNHDFDTPEPPIQTFRIEKLNEVYNSDNQMSAPEIILGDETQYDTENLESDVSMTF